MPDKTVAINPDATAILPGNQKLTRAQVLSRLGLNPGTPPEAWLAIVHCGNNASALKPAEARALLKAKKLTAADFDASVLSRIQPR